MHILLLLIMLLFSPETQERKELIITKQRVQVSGLTSLGKFNCDFSRIGRTDTLKLNSSGGLKSLKFAIPVKDFACGNFLLNKDFRSTLKEVEYPFALVEVFDFREKSGKIYCHLILNIVGQRLEFYDLSLHKSIDGLTGKLVLNFDELKLSPPNKLGGMIKVDNQLDLELLLGM